MYTHVSIRPFAPVVAAAALVATGAIAAAPASATQSTLKVREKIVATHVDDVGKKGPSLGDRLLFVSKLRSGTVPAGKAVGDCTWHAGKSDATAEYYCTVVFRLRGGQIVITGLFSYARLMNTFAITGGTGRFRDAAGEVVARTLTEDTFEDTFRFAK